MRTATASGKVKGVVVNDVNGNGEQDEGEPGITNVDDSTLPEGAEQTAGTDPTAVNVVAGGTATDSDGYQLPASESPSTSPSESPSESKRIADSSRANYRSAYDWCRDSYEAPVTEPEFPTDSCVQSGGVVSTAMCCESGQDFPNTYAIGACSCAPEFSTDTQVRICPEDYCFDGTECVPTESPPPTAETLTEAPPTKASPTPVPPTRPTNQFAAHVSF